MMRAAPDSIRARLVELATYCAAGGSSSVYSGSALWVQMIEGAGGGGSGGAKIPNFLPYHATRVAATARAVAEGLEVGDQVTVWVCYFTGLHTRELQASALSIKPAALRQRLQKIEATLAAWFTEAGRADRAARRAELEAERQAARLNPLQQMTESAAFRRRLEAARIRWHKSETAAEARERKAAAASRMEG